MDLQKIRGITEALSNEIVNLEQFTSNLELKQIELTDKENSLNAREKSLVNRESVLLNKKSSIELRDKDITRNKEGKIISIIQHEEDWLGRPVYVEYKDSGEINRVTGQDSGGKRIRISHTRKV